MCCPECGHDDKGCLFMLLLAAGACIVLSPFAVYGAFAFWGHATTGNPVADFSNSYDFIFGCPITTFYVLAGVVSFPFVIRIYCRQIRWKWRNHKENVMPKIGILFDVDAFNGGLYGYAAYKVFFAAIDTRQLAGCLLSDGDTQATLLGQANHYCIAVTAPNPAMISVVKNALWESHAEGLLSPTARFMDSALVDKEPLVVSARIGADGRLLDCTTGWVIAAWKECQPYSSSVADESSPKAQNKKHWWQFWKA